MEYNNFTSLPPEEERAFIVFEKRTREASSKSLQLGVIAGGIVFLLVMVLFLAFDAPENKHAAAAEEESELGAEDKPAKPAAKAEEPVAPAEEAPAEAPAAEGEGAAAEGAAAGAAEAAPEPPKGATKAPPTALIK